MDLLDLESYKNFNISCWLFFSFFRQHISDYQARKLKLYKSQLCDMHI